MNDSAKPVYRITDLAIEERPRERLVQLVHRRLAPSNCSPFFCEWVYPARMRSRWASVC